MLDLLQATSILYGNCSQEPDSDTIYADGKALTVEQLEEVTAKAVELKAERDSTQYQRDRAEEYTRLNQDELRFDDVENGTTTWQDAINAIKAKYPKPTQ